MQPLLTQLINLPGIEVEDFSDLGEQIIVEVEVTSAQAICPRCGQLSHQIHQNHRYLARDLDLSQRQVGLCCKNLLRTENSLTRELAMQRLQRFG